MSQQSASELSKLASRSFDKGDFRGAINWAEQAEAQARRNNETTQELSAIYILAINYANLGDAKQGLEYATRLMARARQAENEQYLLLGTKLFASRVTEIDGRNRWKEIKPILLESLEIARRLNDSHEEIDILRKLGEGALSAGHEDEALKWLQQSLNKLPNNNVRHFMAFVIYTSMSELMVMQNDLDEALRYAEMSLGSAEEDGNPNWIYCAKQQVAFVEKKRGELATALELAKAIKKQAQEYNWFATEAEAESLIADIQLDLGFPEKALTSAKRAVELMEKTYSKKDILESLILLGRCLQALKQQDEAKAILQKARRMSQELDYEDHFEEAEKLLDKLN